MTKLEEKIDHILSVLYEQAICGSKKSPMIEIARKDIIALIKDLLPDRRDEGEINYREELGGLSEGELEEIGFRWGFNYCRDKILRRIEEE